MNSPDGLYEDRDRTKQRTRRNGDARLILGIDLGSAAAHATLTLAGHENEFQILSYGSRASKGRPLEMLTRILQENIFGDPSEKQREVLKNTGNKIHCIVTGNSGDLVLKLVPAERTNEVLAVATAIHFLHPEARTILDLGGQFTKFILPGRSVDEGLVTDCALNGLCAAGSGAFLEQQAVRLKMSIRELGMAAMKAERGATIAGRCSVFAKSDMIHLQQKGAPVEEIAYGLCLALVRTFISTVLGHRKIEPPVAFVGGGAANPGLIRAFRHVLDLEESQMIVDPNHKVMGAFGATLLQSTGPAVEVGKFMETLTSTSSSSSIPTRDGADPDGGRDCVSDAVSNNAATIGITGLTGVVESEWRDNPEAFDNVETGTYPPLDGGYVRKDESQVISEDPGESILPSEDKIPALLGIDVGSVSTNVVVLSPDNEVYQGIYLPTKGRPVEVLAQSMAILRERFGERLQIIASGATGSGRHLAGRLLGLDVVHNEITAQMISASAYVPNVDTIFEIGGQDSKYIGARSGHLEAFEMNKICAAGTGSFLEEQAEGMGVKIVGEFSRRAFRSKQPHDLGSHCTVFMDTEVVRAMQSGADVNDLCAGLAYSIAKNYLDRVVAGRRIGENVVFSGGTASNDSVVAAFGHILGRPIHVHPANRIAGAIGAALLAKRFANSSMRRSRRFFSSFRGMDAIKDYTLKSFECHRCPNRCQVNRVIVGDRTAHFGDACERFAGLDSQGQEQNVVTPGSTPARRKSGQPTEWKKSSKEATAESRSWARGNMELFELRKELLADHLPKPHLYSQPGPATDERKTEGQGGRLRVGIPMASLNLELAPLWATFLDELGFEPILSGETTPAMINSGSHGLPSEVCLPLKSAAGHIAHLVDQGIERVFLPNVLELFPRNDGDTPHTCLFAQCLSDMVRTIRPSIVWSPHVCLSSKEGINESVKEFSGLFKREPEEILSALKKGLRMQELFREARESVGRKVLKDNSYQRAVVVIGKPYNCHDPYMNLDLARHLKRLNLKAIPMDMIPLADIRLGSRFRVLPWTFNRDQIRTLEFISQDPRLYPLMITNFGCGPDAFSLKHISELVSHRPHLILEFDEHRGEAGLVTRLEAFFDEIDEHISRKRKKKKRRSVAIRRLPKVQKGTCHVPVFCDHSHIFAAVLSGAGIDIKMMSPPDAETVRLAEEVGSGKECHPYNMVAADLAKLVHSGLYSEGDSFFIPGTTNPCLMSQYGDGARYLLRSLDEPGITVWDPAVFEMEEICGVKGMVSFYEGLLAVDMLMIATCRFRPYEKHPGSIDSVHEDNLRLVAHTVENKGDMPAVMGDCIRRLRQVPLTQQPRFPVVGIAGDIYTRINHVGNANLYKRLEAMGCEVWPHPYFAGYEDYCRFRDTMRSWKRDALGSAFYYLLTSGGLKSLSNALKKQIGPDLAAHCVEPPPSRLSELASPYVGPMANTLLHENVGKIVDFINRGAAGVINAVGMNCMMGIASDAAIRAIKRDAPLVPIITLAYGGVEGPAQRIRLETFIHQVGGKISGNHNMANQDMIV